MASLVSQSRGPRFPPAQLGRRSGARRCGHDAAGHRLFTAIYCDGGEEALLRASIICSFTLSVNSSKMSAQFQHPLQCLRLVQRSPTNILIGSAGSKLYSYSAETGQRLAVWPADVASSETNPVDAESTPEQGPPEKKRKVSSSESQSIEKPAWSNIPIVTGTSNGEHIVALTAEDKCVRVFQLQEDGSFVQLSER